MRKVVAFFSLPFKQVRGAPKFGMSLVIPDDILRAAKMSAAELQQEIALLLFQQEKLTLGQASTFAGISQSEFQRLLAGHHIAVHYDAQEFAADVDTLHRLGYL